MGRVLKDSEDAYGHSIADYFEKGRGLEIIEREDGYIDLSSGPSNYFHPYDQWPEVEKNAIELAHGTVLDIGTGAGRVCLHLQEKGLECTGLDNSPNALRIAAARGVSNVILKPFEEIGTLNRKFDTITFFGNNFGLFGNRTKALEMLEILARITSDNAVILAESVDPLRTDLTDHLEYQKENRSKGKLPGQLTIRVRYRKYITPWFEYLIVSRDEMEGILKGSRWHVSRFIDGKGPLYVAVLVKD